MRCHNAAHGLLPLNRIGGCPLLFTSALLLALPSLACCCLGTVYNQNFFGMPCCVGAAPITQPADAILGFLEAQPLVCDREIVTLLCPLYCLTASAMDICAQPAAPQPNYYTFASFPLPSLCPSPPLCSDVSLWAHGCEEQSKVLCQSAWPSWARG